MYHETTYSQARRRRAVRALAAIGVAAAVAAIVAVGLYLKWAGREQGAAALRESVLRAAVQCMAVEGSFPATVGHLVDSYGLTVNDKDYVVSYEWLGDNVVPSVVVRPR